MTDRTDAHTDSITGIPAHAKGKRPHVFDDTVQDHLLAMILELASDLWTVRDQLDAQTAFLRDKVGMTDDAITAITDAADYQAAQGEKRRAFLARLMRTLESEI